MIATAGCPVHTGFDPLDEAFLRDPYTVLPEVAEALPEGAKPFLWLAAAGRDGDVFPQPDTFDPERRNARRTLAFGRGIHFCIGSALGRLEAALALEELTRRFLALRLAPPDQAIPFHPNISFRGPQTLWVQA